MHTPQALVTSCHPHFDMNIILESTLLRITQYSVSESPPSPQKCVLIIEHTWIKMELCWSRAGSLKQINIQFHGLCEVVFWQSVPGLFYISWKQFMSLWESTAFLLYTASPPLTHTCNGIHTLIASAPCVFQQFNSLVWFHCYHTTHSPHSHCNRRQIETTERLLLKPLSTQCALRGFWECLCLHKNISHIFLWTSSAGTSNVVYLFKMSVMEIMLKFTLSFQCKIVSGAV